MNLKQITIHYWNSYRQGILITLTIFIVALIVNALVLLVPPPVSITRNLFNFHYGLAFLLIIFLGMILSRKGIVWDAISLTLTLVLFSIPLIYKWQTATYNGVMFGGLIPWSDAQNYYSGAHQLMTTGHLSTWTTRRPLFGGFLAALLSITSNNLQFSLVILAVINGLTVFLSSRMIQKIHGPFAAATFLGICYWYYCAITAGTIMSEQIGLSFGSIGLAVLIQGTQNNSLSKSAYGIFLLTVALNARAGAFFILPVIALWLGINFKDKLGWRKPIAVGITAIAIGMVGNLAMVKAVGFSNGVPFSNYSYTLYGLATGNTGWKQVLTDYPGVREDQVFDLAVQKIRENPSLFFVGILRSYQDYFTKGYGPFSFLRLLNDRRYSGNQLFLILTWLGLAFAVFNRKKRQYGLILAAFLGIVLSISLVPPKDSGLMRIFAATIPFTAYFASTGVAFFEQLLKKSEQADRVSADGWSSLSLLMPFSATLLILCFAGPLLVKISSQSHKLNQSLSCPPEKEELAFHMSHGSSIYLADDLNIRESYLPNIRLTDFRTGTEAGPDFYPFLTESLLSLGPGHTISIGMYQKAEANSPDSIQRGYLITNGTPLKPGSHQICVTSSQDMNLKDVFFYYESGGVVTSQERLSIFHRNPTIVDGIRKSYEIGILLIYVLVSLGYFGFRSTSPAKRLLMIGGVVLISGGVLVYLHSNAVPPLAWERRSLEMSKAIHTDGYSYEIHLGINWMDRRTLGESPAIVYEDNIPLKRPNSTQFSTNKLGRGRYSIQDGFLIFSSSDNSNPRTNGRRYELYWPVPISLTLQRVSYVLAIISVFLLSLHLRKLNQDS